MPGNNVIHWRYSLGETKISLLFPKQPTEESIAQFASSSFQAEVLLSGMTRDVAAFTMKIQLVLRGQFRYKRLIRIGISAAQLVIEVSYREDDPQRTPNLQQQSKQGNGINAAGDGYTDTFSRTQELVPPDVRE